MLRLTAFGKSFGGTSVGISDCRAGVSKAQAAEAIDVKKNIGQTRVNPRDVTHESVALQVSMIDCVVIMRRLRSTTSATTPPISEHKMIGIARNAPTIPSASAECVSRYTCQLIATSCICDPVTETICPIQSKRKSR